VQLRHCLVRRMPCRMLVRTGDVGFALDGHPRKFPLPFNRSLD
jgi:hypothetical protein